MNPSAAASGRRYTLTPQADLAAFYAADTARYRGTARQHLVDAVSLETFTAVYADCPSRGFAFDGQPIGGMIFDGSQAHIAVLPEHHGRWTFLFKPALEWLFTCKPEILVEIENDNPKALAFMARNGWKPLNIPTREIGAKVRFLISRKPAKPGRKDAAGQLSNR